jgi:hypothetical protein
VSRAAARTSRAPSGANLRENVVQKRIGRYEVQARIGEGATADVYRAYDPGIDRVLAI